MAAPAPPAPLLHVAYSCATSEPAVWVYCPGYELGSWRRDALIEHLLEWLPEFCLKYSANLDIGSGNMMRRMREVTRALYTTDDYERRGELGELLLHAICRQEFKTIPAVSKIYYQDEANHTVKGFDLVHVAPKPEGLELWLGESKFYSDPKGAARAAAASLGAHCDAKYLRAEFAAIINKIDDKWPHADQLKKLLDPNTTLDEIFARRVVPVLLTYPTDGVSVAAVCDAFHAALDAEVKDIVNTFGTHCPLEKSDVRLFLVPLDDKQETARAFDAELKALQGRAFRAG